jgi:hypothetical protein
MFGQLIVSGLAVVLLCPTGCMVIIYKTSDVLNFAQGDGHDQLLHGLRFLESYRSLSPSPWP